MIKEVLIGLFKSKVAPQVKILQDLTEQIMLIDELYGAIKELDNKEKKESFAFVCPNCSGSMRINKEDPQYDYCNSCGKGYMELFFGPQKIFKVDDGCVTWWVSATSDKEAVEQVIEYERAGGCELIKDDYWDKDDLDNLAYEISIEDAKRTLFWSDSYAKSTMWDEFVKDSSTHVIGCSEW